MIQLSSLQKAGGLIHGISGKKEGNMSFRLGNPEDAVKNREALLGALKLDPAQCAVMEVQHGINVARVTKADNRGAVVSPSAFRVDAFITKEVGIPLMLLTGDCVPVILFDPQNRVLGLIHASRHNTGKKLITQVLQVMKSEGADFSNIIAGIGPSIRRDSYVLPRKILKSDMAAYDVFAQPIDMTHVSLDLPGFIKEELMRAGVSALHIEDCGIDTATNREYFSHYYSSRSAEPEGRFATVVSMQ